MSENGAGYFSNAHDRTSADLVDRACRLWEAQRQAAARADVPRRAARAFTIALSREAGTRAAATAKEVGERLGWHVYDQDLLEKIAQEMGLRTKLLKCVDERQQSWLQETAEAFLSETVDSEWNPSISESSYVRHLVETVMALGTHGECVIVGRGAAFILPAETTLRVRLTAPVKARVAALADRLGTSASEAARRLRTIDRERRDFVQDHFYKDPSEPSNYDLIVNTSRFSTAKTAELIVEGLHRLQAEVVRQGAARS
ncbi:MAG TPA: cytidylate kinase-like family protein [Gemmataceae bacterium]|nr:cytidylate kinase-like family protein [Gemmataceae bacterium]